MQSNAMEINQAEEHLHTIRTLMERSAVYRRALAPIMLLAGVLGIVSAGIGLSLHLETDREFTALWLATAALAVAGAFLVARRQALKDNEPFWSPPTKRVAQAIAPPLTAGMVSGLFFLLNDTVNAFTVLIPVWTILYGCALHAAGFFMPRGIRLLGWIYVILGCSMSIVISAHVDPSFVMGFVFGLIHFVYGIYLYVTERGKNVA